MGRFPVESVDMLAKIAAAIEPHRPSQKVREALKEAADPEDRVTLPDLIAWSVEAALERVTPDLVVVPTRSGSTARSLSRYRLPVWILGISSQEATCQRLQFTYGVHPEHERDHPEDWSGYIREWLKDHGTEGNLVILTEGPSARHPEANHRMEIIDLRR